MSEAHADVTKHIRSYIAVFATLGVFTIITVIVSRIDLGGGANIAVALAIATFKASLVAAIFMHLKWEKSISIWWVLGLCAIFVVVLILVPMLGMLDAPPGVKVGTWG